MSPGRLIRDEGSSPLARGLLKVPGCQAPRGGIIPARAGFTWTTWSCPVTRADHPRSRGVYRSAGRPYPAVLGSSPLARGLPFVFVCFVRAFGIIPARAGFTPWSAGTGGRRRDHPRSRGVYTFSFRPPSPPTGSSPLARGLLVVVLPGRVHVGIIPARAGFTSTSCWLARVTGGSSPLARGLLLASSVRRQSTGIIPARAGFTPASSATAPPARDHPRSRGVYSCTGTSCGRSAGSSPLARGLPRRLDHRPDHRDGSSPLARGLPSVASPTP